MTAFAMAIRANGASNVTMTGKRSVGMAHARSAKARTA
jgi:hypothetical protein